MKKAIKGIVAVFVFLAMMIPTPLMETKAAESYEIVFRSGSQGTFDVSDLKENAVYNEEHTKVTYRVGAGERFPNVPTIIVKEGYRNDSWSQQLPAVGSAVEGKEVYVAKYTRLVHGVEFTVRYEDENGVELSTPSIITAELGEDALVRARDIEGYVLLNDGYGVIGENGTATVPVLKENMEVVFTYAADGTQTPPIVENVIYVEGEPVYVDVVEGTTTLTPVPPTATTTLPQANVQGQTQTPAADAPVEDIENNDTPLANGDQEEELDEEDTPLSDGKTEHNNAPYIAGGIGIVALLALIVYFLSRKKKQQAEE